MTSPPEPGHRPVPVTLAAVLVVLEGIVVVAVGIALVVFRDNEIEQIPALLARVDGTLPFDSGQDLGAYMAVVGSLVAVLGALLAVLGWGVARGSRLAYVLGLALQLALAAAFAVLAAKASDDLARGALQVVAVLLAVSTAVLLALLLGRRSRAWVVGGAPAA